MEKRLYSLIPIEDFKLLLGVDDREDKISRYCLMTATYTIEKFCSRRLLKKRHTDFLDFNGDHIFTLKEYPVRKIISVKREHLLGNSEEVIDPQQYYCLPDPGMCVDLPFFLILKPPLSRSRNRMIIRVVYSSGYSAGKEPDNPNGVPPDLASACLELAAWNMARYKGRRIGMTGNVRGSGRDGEHFEMSIPLQVRELLEPYKRRVI